MKAPNESILCTNWQEPDRGPQYTLRRGGKDSLKKVKLDVWTIP